MMSSEIGQAWEIQLVVSLLVFIINHHLWINSWWFVGSTFTIYDGCSGHLCNLEHLMLPVGLGWCNLSLYICIYIVSERASLSAVATLANPYLVREISM